ncbi:MAG: MazG-like family protein [Planctomycetota bacterium]|nr:MazG-like family protein [Planctomycetota bacterium]
MHNRESTAPQEEGTSNCSDCLARLGREIVEINHLNGWNVTSPENWSDTYRIPAMLALIHSEVSEALEAFRNDDKADFEEEIADIIIRTLDLSTGLGIQTDECLRRKMDTNRRRGHKHGGKRV